MRVTKYADDAKGSNQTIFTTEQQNLRNNVKVAADFCKQNKRSKIDPKIAQDQIYKLKYNNSVTQFIFETFF